MRCVDNSTKHINYEYGYGKNCSKISIQNMDSGTAVQKHAYKYYIGHSFSKHILSSVVGGCSRTRYSQFCLVWVIMRIQTEALEKEGIQS